MIDPTDKKCPMTFSSSPLQMKMALVATIDSVRESIVGFLKVTNAHGYCQKRSNRGYQTSILMEVALQLRLNFPMQNRAFEFSIGPQ